VTLVLDASMALAWLLKRKDLDEAIWRVSAWIAYARPGRWFGTLVSGVANSLLLAERQRVIRIDESADFLSSMSIWR